MKKLFTFVLTACLLMGCSQQSENDVPTYASTETSSYTVDTEELSWIVDFAANLHNDAVVAFFEYAEANNIDGYDENVQEILEEFMTQFVMERLVQNGNITEIFAEQEYAPNEETLQTLGESLINIVANGDDYYSIDSELKEFCVNSIPEFETEQELGMYNFICGAAIGTNRLWEIDWDYERFPLGTLSYASADKDGDNSDNNKNQDTETEQKKKEKEDQVELKKADIRGALEGAANGAIWGGKIAGFGGAAWGALIGASAGAASASAAEGLMQKYVTENMQIL